MNRLTTLTGLTTLTTRNSARLAPPLFTRHYVSRTNTKNNTSANPLMFVDQLPPLYSNNNNLPQQQQQQHPAKKDYNVYFKSLPKSQLFSLLLIGLCSLNKFTLSTAIKMFPYIPYLWVKLLVSRLYCGGESMTEVLQCGKQLQLRGISNMMLSLTIENSDGVKQLDNIDEIVALTIDSLHSVLKPNLLSQINNAGNDINDIAPGYIALKPSALVPNPHLVLANFNTHPDAKQLLDNCTKITNEVFKLNQQLYKLYPSRKSPFFVATIDAEKFALQHDGVYSLQRQLMHRFNKVEYPLPSVIGTWQLYLADSMKHIQHDIALAKQQGYTVGLKIVRGAYIHSEPNRSSIIFNTKQQTDDNYNKIMLKLINDMATRGNKSTVSHLMVASHNMDSQLQAAAIINSLPRDHYARANVTLGQLLGMADNVAFELIENNQMKNVVKYVPWGPTKETRDYLLRRLQENGDAVRSDNGWALVKRVCSTLI